MGSPVIFNGSRSKLLTSKGLLLQSGAVVDNDGSKNYVTLGNFENNATTGWSATGCATVTNGLPVSVGTGAAAFSSSNGGQTKGANTNAPAIDSTSALSGTYSLNLATTGAGVIGDGYISQSYTIDKSDQAKVLSYKFSYKVASGTPALPGTSANTYAVAIYDIVNNAWLGVAGNFNIVQSSGTGIAQGSFQSASNTTGIQIFIYSPVAPTGTSSLLFDDVFIGPQSLAFGPAMSDWVAYTPTFTGFGTPTSVVFLSRRVGSNLEITGNFTGGTPTATEARITIGYNGVSANVTADSTNVPGTIQIAGIVANTATGAITPYALMEPGKTYLTFGYQDGTHAALTKLNGNAFLGAGNGIGFQAIVPIAGWSSNTSMSSDTDTRVVAMQVSQTSPTATIVSGMSLVKFTSAAAQDTHAGYSTSTGGYTIPVTGFYRATVSVGVSATYAAGSYANVGIGKNSTSTVTYAANMRAGGAEVSMTPLFAGTIYCTAGDVLYPLVQSNATSPTVVADATGNFFMVERLSGPAVIAATESVNARYYASATSISGSLATISWTTKDYDSHNAMSAGTYTIPVSGKYQIDTGLTLTGTFVLNNQMQLEIQKNGTVVTRVTDFAGGAIGHQHDGMSDTLNCLAGDTIRVQCLSQGTAPSIVSSNFENWFSISRSGN